MAGVVDKAAFRVRLTVSTFRVVIRSYAAIRLGIVTKEARRYA